MRRIQAIATAVILLAAAAPSRAAEAPLTGALQVLGTVTNAARPVSHALVIALNLQDLATVQAWTNGDGTFKLPNLRSGIYKVIAVKQGFAPAITTVVPTRDSHRLVLRLEAEKAVKRKNANQEIWELRASLPPDVLRELEFAMAPVELASYEIPRFRGEMLSLTGVTNQPANPAYAQTALGVQGRIGETWQVGIRGNLQRFEDPNDEIRFGGSPVAESSVMSMELRSSPTQSYRVASTKSSFVYATGEETARQADVRAHNFEWQQGDAHVQVRYFAQDNLFRGTAANESNLIEVAGSVPVLQTRRNDLGIAIRVTQESVATHDNALRIADVSANGSLHLVPSFVLHYGMASRIGVDGQEWAPRTGAEWKLTENTSIVGSMLYKVVDRDPSRIANPSLVFLSEDTRVLPRYAYTFGFVSGKDEANRFSAIATISAIDDPLRVVFADEANQFWDGLYVESGDVRRDLRIAYRRQFGQYLAIDVSTAAGTATQRHPALGEREKVYISGDLQSTFSPTRTSLAVSYREIQQPGELTEEDYQSERLHLRMAQSLYLPVDIKLLLGLELARAANSPYLVDALTAGEGHSKKYIGGLAVNF
ncbi:MAG TPA: carboxypeptidase-like regulatory domain-containing protein [Thermoanaerobaculia bacterium]|nr:carboxypeptidase-like regulatory domain-containing protein [Thermoanaerobaculia bacterium]